MELYNLYLTARTPSDSDYLPIEKQGLSCHIHRTDGNGSAAEPAQLLVSISNPSPVAWSGVVSVELAVPKSDPQFFLPGFLYGRNRGACPQTVSCEYPRLREEPTVRPSSSWWMMRGDRLASPVLLIYDCGMVYGLSAAPYWVKRQGEKEPWTEQGGTFLQYAGYSCRLNSGAGEGLCSIGYTLGYENAPWLFIQSHRVEPQQPLGENQFQLDPGETVTFPIAVFCYAAQSETGIYPALETVYWQYHEPPRRGSSICQTVEDLSDAVFRCAYLPEEHMYACFVRKGEGGDYNFNRLGSFSWTNGLSVAVPILTSALRRGHSEMRAQALDCITNILDHCWNPRSGLPYDAYADGKWSIYGWWFDGMHTPGHTAYLVGQGLYYLLKAYEYEQRLGGCAHPDWLEAVKNTVAVLERQKNTEGEYPYIFSQESGAGLEYDSFGSVWCLAVGAAYARLTGDRTYLDGLCASEQHYYQQYVARAVCYGGPLDTDKAVDSEGVLAYLRAVHDLHRITGDSKYLAHMKDGLDYEFTFKFCYRSPVQIPPLSILGWSSCGGSITSTANPHIHPMSSTVVDELLYYAQQTKDPYVISRLKDTVAWGCQTYNTYDGEYGYGEKGWMSERFCYSQGLVCEHYPDGTPASTWFALMPWASGSILEGLTGDLWDLVIDECAAEKEIASILS